MAVVVVLVLCCAALFLFLKAILSLIGAISFLPRLAEERKNDIKTEEMIRTWQEARDLRNMKREAVKDVVNRARLDPTLTMAEVEYVENMALVKGVLAAEASLSIFRDRAKRETEKDAMGREWL